MASIRSDKQKSKKQGIIMIETTKIKSGFDAELMLGGKWFLTAINSLHANNLLDIPSEAQITNVIVLMEDEWDLEITINEVLRIKAKIAIVDSQFYFTTDFNDANFSIALPNFDGLSEAPTLYKVSGDGNNENAICLLINLDLRASHQNNSPLPAGEHLERGIKENATSFLPIGQDIAFGLSKETFSRIANDVWHSFLRADNGTHPLPDKENRQGEWKRVKVDISDNKIKLILEGEVPINLWPDADVSLEVEITPFLQDGKLKFSFDTDLDIDTGLWGDILAFGIGAIIGMIVGIFTGGLVLGPAFGIATTIILEVVEYAAGEIIEKRLRVKDGEGNVINSLLCHDNIIKFASPQTSENTFPIAFLNAIPLSIPIYKDEVDILHNVLYTVVANFDELAVNQNGLAVAGKSNSSEIFESIPATLSRSLYEQDDLRSLTYQVADGQEIELDIEEVFNRLDVGGLKPPLKINNSILNPVLQIPEGKLCCPCLKPLQIRRKNTIITRIKFSDDLELSTADAVKLQDKAGVYLKGLQLIHPENGKAYFRAPANDNVEDNFESLPEF